MIQIKNIFTRVLEKERKCLIDFYQPKAESQVGFGKKDNKEKRVTFAFGFIVASLFALF